MNRRFLFFSFSDSIPFERRSSSIDPRSFNIETILVHLAELIPPDKRSTAFGLFDTGFGIAWFAGSWLMGILYSSSITGLIIFSVVSQLLSLPIFIFAKQSGSK